MPTKLLTWVPVDGGEEAQLGTPKDGVLFTYTFHPTCHRRGPHRLLVEVCGGPAHHLWGCFDEADQPLRNYHRPDNLKSEAEEIAKVLWQERQQWKPLHSTSK